MQIIDLVLKVEEMLKKLMAEFEALKHQFETLKQEFQELQQQLREKEQLIHGLSTEKPFSQKQPQVLERSRVENQVRAVSTSRPPEAIGPDGDNTNSNIGTVAQSRSSATAVLSSSPESKELLEFIAPISDVLQQAVSMAQQLNGKLPAESKHRLESLYMELIESPHRAQQLPQQWSVTKAVEEVAMRWAQRFFHIKEKLVTPQPQMPDLLPLSVQLNKTWTVIKEQFLNRHIATIDQIGFPFDPSVHLALSSDVQSSGARVVRILEVGFQRTADAPKGAGVVLDKARVRRGD